MWRSLLCATSRSIRLRCDDAASQSPSFPCESVVHRPHHAASADTIASAPVLTLPLPYATTAGIATLLLEATVELHRRNHATQRAHNSLGDATHPGRQQQEGIARDPALGEGMVYQCVSTRRGTGEEAELDASSVRSSCLCAAYSSATALACRLLTWCSFVNSAL